MSVLHYTAPGDDDRPACDRMIITAETTTVSPDVECKRCQRTISWRTAFERWKSNRRTKCVECGEFIAQSRGRYSDALGGYRCDSCYERAVEEL